VLNGSFLAAVAASSATLLQMLLNVNQHRGKAAVGGA